MTYQAIARKWRPTTFKEIAGQTHVTRTLSNAIKLGRVHHAFLFSGPRGVGKTTAARALARALNCEQGPIPDPCGTCASCIEILAGSSPDVIEIDGASNNSVDDIRELRESVRYMPVHGRSKVYIVDEVHMLSKGAFNALLKTLEEPPPKVVFMFATTEPQRIPDTILSRVQRFDFKRIPPDVVIDRLGFIAKEEGVDIGEDALRLIARAGEGSMRDAQSLMDQVISFAGNTPTMEQVADILGLVDRELLYQMLEGIIAATADDCLRAIDAVYNYGYELSEFTSEMLTLLRNATLVGLSPKSKEYLDVPSDERARLELLVQQSSTDILVRAFHVMLDVHDLVARSNRPRLVLEMAVARLVSIRPAQPIDRLLQRIDHLEQRIRAAGGITLAPARGNSRPRSSDDDKESSPAAEVDSPTPTDPVIEEAVKPQLAPSSDEASPPMVEAAAEQEANAETAKPPVIEAGPQVQSAPVPEEQPTNETEAPTVDVAGESSEEEPPQSDPDAIPEVSVELPHKERFEVFRAWLERGGARYEVWAQDCIFVGVHPPYLELEFTAGFRLKHVSFSTKDERLLKGVKGFFPGCTQVKVTDRDQQSGRLTHRENVAKEAAEAQAELEQLIRDDSDIKTIAAHFDASIRSVHSDHRAPIPPALQPKER
jgi:DNA polymerase III subunit gamma/tau